MLWSSQSEAVRYMRQVQDFEAEDRVLEACAQSRWGAEPLHRLSAAEEPEAWCA